MNISCSPIERVISERQTGRERELEYFIVSSSFPFPFFWWTRRWRKKRRGGREKGLLNGAKERLKCDAIAGAIRFPLRTDDVSGGQIKVVRAERWRILENGHAYPNSVPPLSTIPFETIFIDWHPPFPLTTPSQTGFCPSFSFHRPRLISFGPLSRLPLNEQTIFHQGVFLHPVSSSSSFFFFFGSSILEIFLKYRYSGIFKYLFLVSVAIWRNNVSNTVLININALFI